MSFYVVICQKPSHTHYVHLNYIIISHISVTYYHRYEIHNYWLVAYGIWKHNKQINENIRNQFNDASIVQFPCDLHIYTHTVA